ncbi:plasmid recombination protein [Microbacteriaceae bacterium K1510]|nr:plasmid recombination protein [Microbacteriaceae bacterium K1510]
MSKCKFIRIEAWARKGPHQKNSQLRKPCMAGVLVELVREPQACPHIEDPKPPEILYGGDPTKVWDEAYAQAEQAVDAAGAKLKSTALVIVVGVASYPAARCIVERDPEERTRFERWRAKTIRWLHGEFGAHLKLVVGHSDEAYPHVHFAALPTLGADRRLRIGDVHPGLRAEQRCRDTGGSRREQKQAHQEAMRAFQDRYYAGVAVEFGFARYGKKRQRLNRDEWKAQTKQLRAIAAAQDKLARDRHHLAAKAARLVVERTVEAQREAAAQVTAVEAAAVRQIEQMKQRALTQIQRLAIENGALDAELKHRATLLDEQAKRIAALEAMLVEQNLSPKPGD